MCLVILVPFVSSVNAVEVSRFAWPVFVFPIVARRVRDILFQVEDFLLLI